VAQMRPAGEITKLHPETAETGGVVYSPKQREDWKPYVWNPSESENENAILEAFNRSVAPPGTLSPSDASNTAALDHLKATPQEIAQNIAKEKAEEQKRLQALQKAARAARGDSEDRNVVVGATPAPN